MGEKYMFFDSIDGEDERFYTADEFAEYFRQFISNGILNGGDNLRVTADGDDMTIEIKPGYAWIEGYLYKIDTEPLKLTLDTADPILNRIDRIVIRLDKSLEKRYIKAFVLKGIPAESPVAPEITRNDNVYEISLAQVVVETGKSYINQSNIIDERFDSNVCGFVNSLIKADVSHITNMLENEWQTWFEAIEGETYVPRADLKEGFITTPEDKLYFFPDSILQDDKNGWPIGTHDIDVTLEALGRDEDGNLFINELSQLYERVIRYNVLSDQPSHQLWTGAQLAIPFTPEVEGKHIKVTMRLQRYSIGRIRALIYESDDTGLPDTSKEIGRYFATDYSDLQTTFTDVTWEMDLSRNLNPNKTYYLILYGYNESYYIQAEYADSPGESKYLLSTDNGSTWTAYERTPLLEIEGVAPVLEGSITISYNNIANFKKHGKLSFELLESENSYYEADMLDLDGNVIKSNIEVGSYLFDDNLGKDTKLRIRIIRSLGEDPRLANYEHMWVVDMSSNRLEQAVVPSDNPMYSINGNYSVESGYQGAARLLLKFRVSLGGRYRIKARYYKNNTTQSGYFSYQYSGSELGRVGLASSNGGYTEVVVDLNSVPPGAEIEVLAGMGSLSGILMRITDIVIMGSNGYSRFEVV